MKSQYKISENIILNIHEGFFIDNTGHRIEITAYQERFLKFLILNQKKPCIRKDIINFIYRGESIPKAESDFFSQLVKKCPALRERISVQKYELMDIGYRYKLPKTIEFAEFWPELNSEELTKSSELDFSDILTTMRTMEKCITPEQKTILRILMLHHDKPLMYQTIIELSHTVHGKNEQPLKNTYQVIKALNELQEAIPVMEELLEPVYLNTVAYLYQPFPGEEETKTSENKPLIIEDTDKEDSKSQKISVISYPSANQLDETFYHVDGNVYISAVNAVAITYLDKNLVKYTSLPPKVAYFLDILIQNTGNTIKKETLAQKLYGEDYYALDSKQIDDRLYDTARRLKQLVPEIIGCLQIHRGIGYSIQFTSFSH